MRFVDHAVIEVQSGNGGSGCLAFRREKYVPFGGPIGGDGGKGGDVWLAVDGNANTLLDFRYRRRIAAQNGRPGEGRGRTGRDGLDSVIVLPKGTRVYDDTTGMLLTDLVHADQRICVCYGGRGGRGNRRFATSTNRAPRQFEEGFAGENKHLRFELNVLADVGLIGLPNVGKSSLVRALTKSQTAVGDYAFTTRVPNLGALNTDSPGEEFILADLPGLLSGASEGKGLGLQFLGHISRCRVLVHVLDATRESLIDDYRIIKKEVHAHSADNALLEEIVVFNKIDLVKEEKRKELTWGGNTETLMVSAITDEGLPELVNKIASTCRAIEKLPSNHESELPDLSSDTPAIDESVKEPWHPLK